MYGIWFVLCRWIMCMFRLRNLSWLMFLVRHKSRKEKENIFKIQVIQTEAEMRNKLQDILQGVNSKSKTSFSFQNLCCTCTFHFSHQMMSFRTGPGAGWGICVSVHCLKSEKATGYFCLSGSSMFRCYFWRCAEAEVFSRKCNFLSGRSRATTTTY
jgi:hypothetical protein